MTIEEMNQKIADILNQFFYENADEKRQYVYINEIEIINPITSSGSFYVNVKINPEIPFSQ